MGGNVEKRVKNPNEEQLWLFEPDEKAPESEENPVEHGENESFVGG